MWVSATSSERPHRRRRFFGTAAALVALAIAPMAGGTTLMSVEEALALAFGGSETDRQTLFLTEVQLERVEELAGDRPPGAMVTRYRAVRDGVTVGWAYLDTHRVRTLPETLMVVVDPGGRVSRVEVVVFREPLEYLPRSGWYEQLGTRRLDDELRLDRGIRPVTGATLTAVATVRAVRRVLAIHGVTTETEGT